VEVGLGYAQPDFPPSLHMKFIEPRPFANPDATARKLMELAHAVEPVQDGRIYISRRSMGHSHSGRADRRPNTAPA
jgi:hypothetical protein